jgi:hypothetical protein
MAAQGQAANVTLSYDPSLAGDQVLVAPLDGGTINGAGAQTLTVANDGTLNFSFLPPSAPGRYQVVTQLNGAEITFPFVVPASN